MRTFLRYFIFLPLALLLLVFCVANRHFVNVRLDPFAADDAAAALSMPLFALILTSLVLGVALGGVTVWLAQGKYRKAAKTARAEADRLRTEAAKSVQPAPVPMIAPH